MKKTVLVTMGLSALLVLGGCSSSHSSKDSSKKVSVAKVEKKDVKKDAEKVLAYIYGGKEESFNTVSTESADTVKDHLINTLSKKQETFFTENGHLADYALKVDGSIYTANEIIKDYSKAYLDQTNKLTDYKVKSVSINGNDATVKATFTPIASLSEANPIGSARSEIFGGIDNDTIVRDSQNKDVKEINRLITLKLYGVYYGQMDSNPELAPKTKEIEFTLKKSDKHYVANLDTFTELAKASREKVYSDSKGSDSVTKSSSSKL
ncbi:hypothetical protein ACVQ8P_06010 [Dellaglioa sp. BT-FLS60]